MTFNPPKRAPIILAAAVLALVCALQLAQFDFFERIERMTYDLRARAALNFPAPTATNLAFVSIGEDSIKAVQNGSLGFRFGLYWPREVYGRLLDELREQNAKTVAFDVLFRDLRPDQPQVEMANGAIISSDEFFARQLQHAGNAILGDTPDAPLPKLFATNAFALGDITSEKDSDGVLRHIKAFRIYRRWHPIFEKAAEEYNLDLAGAKLLPGKIILPQIGTTNIVEVPVDAKNDFALTNFVGDRLPRGVAPTARAFSDERIWQMGIVLAAQELNLDLSNAEIDLPGGKIVLRGKNGIERTIPVDRDGNFYVNWRIQPNDPRLLQASIESLLAQNFRRLTNAMDNFTGDFSGKLVVVGSTAQGNDLSDRGATPLARDTFLVSKYWNVANSVIENRFIHRASRQMELALIIFLGALTVFLTLQLPAFSSLGGSFLLAVVYSAAAFFAFVKFQLWLPLFFPIVGAILAEHIVLVAYRVLFEEAEKRRVKSIFSKIVAPDIVNELLQVQKLSLGGGRREITVYFADVRGFTEFTDQSQARIVEFIRENNLSGDAAEMVINEEARETLATVNIYLGAIADVIKRHNGTLDKYIGDCVMAFWGAPVPNEQHAVAAVRAAIDAQRAVYEINLKRVEENQRRELEMTFTSGGKIPKPKLPILLLGSGINTGMVTVGLMGSSEHLLNYTVFGREVNLASRLEAVSGRGRIIISEATFKHLQRDDAELAATCVELPAVKVKGIVAEIKIFEVTWRPPNASPFDEELFSAASTEGASFTGMTRKF